MSREKHTNTTIPGCGFHHVAIRTSNWDASQKFYTEGLGFSPKVNWGEAPSRAVLLDTGDGNYLEIFEREPLENAGEANILHFCFRVDDCDAATQRAREAGAEVTLEPKEPEPFAKLGLKTRIAFIKGPDGEICEFFESNDL
ncbi:MAG TPA: VOC family protein [Abditibacteriaceae bacterium]|jgi:glyoxylase I family protein